MSKSIIQSVSYPVELQQFLDENPDLSLSKMLQSKIIEIRDNRKLVFAEVERLRGANQRLVKEIQGLHIELNKLKGEK